MNLGNTTKGGVAFLQSVVKMAEELSIGWLYWSSDPGGWSPIARDRKSDMPNAEALVRSYPRAVSGYLMHSSHDLRTNQFSFSFVSNKNSKSKIEIAVPKKFLYPELRVISTTDNNCSYNIKDNILYFSGLEFCIHERS